MFRILLQLIIVIVVIGGGVLIAKKLMSSRKTPPRSEKEVVAPLVDVTILNQQDKQIFVNGYGTVRAKITVQVVPQVSGKVIEVDKDFVNGGFFAANQTLITIDPRDYELAVQQAEAAVARAEVQLETEKAEAAVARQEWQELRPDEQPTSPLVFREPQIAQAQAEIKAAQAALATAKLNLERTRISLPFNGRVIEENVDAGQYLVTGQSIASVYSTEVMEIPVPLEDKELAWFNVPVNPQMAAAGNPDDNRAKVDVIAQFAGAEYHWPALAVRTESQIDEASRMVHVIVEVSDPFKADNDKVPLVPGMFVEVMIKGKILKQVFTIPRHNIHNGNEVWLLQDDRLKIQQVNIVRRDKQFAYVITGLQNEDVIITSSLDAVTDGMKVRTTSTEGTLESDGFTEKK